jgi:hypothetical protein
MKVYDVIIIAEDIYINEISHLRYPGMCWCLKVAATRGLDFKEKNRKGHPSYKDLVTNIPEFNPEFLKATNTVLHAGLDFWWDNNDTKSRLNAFKVLKGIYKESVREFEY